MSRFKHMNHPTRTSNYSQNEEENIITTYFKGVKGTFVDIGANDGVTFSNTRRLAELSWQGVFIEPSPKAFNLLQSNYEGLKGFYFYNVALSNRNGNAILHESGPLVNIDDVGLVSTFHAAEMDRFKSSVQYEPITVKCFTWKTLLNRLKFKTFDFVSLDVEGEEMNILPSMDLSKTSLICLEWNSKPEAKTAYEEYLQGFKLIYTSAENLIYGR